MTIGARLKIVRKSKGHTQQSLAEAIGVSRGVITNIEHNITEPQPLVIRAICKTLFVNEEWLLKGDGEMAAGATGEESMYVLSEICNLCKELSPAEQDYILDLIRTFQRHKNAIKDTEASNTLNG